MVADCPRLIPRESAVHAEDCYAVTVEDLIIQVEEWMQAKLKARLYTFETLFNEACRT